MYRIVSKGTMFIKHLGHAWVMGVIEASKHGLCSHELLSRVKICHIHNNLIIIETISCL